jgi:hypothetical protein
MRFGNQPIIVAHVRGTLDADVYAAVAIRVAALAENVTGKITLVLDLSQARVEILDMIDVLAQMTRSWRGTPSDPRFITLVVTGGVNSSLMAAHLIRQWEGWKKVFMFTSMAQALACARGPVIMEREEAITARGDATEPGV